VAEAFAEAGFDFLKFNFSHNGGTVDNPIDFSDLEAFSENTYSRELEDLEIITKLALSGIEVNGQKKSWDKLALIGHSRGGGIVILHAANSSHVSHLATWASVADFGERFNFDMEAWKETGVTTVINGRTKQDMPHRYSFYEDFIRNEEDLTVKTAAEEIDQPWLIAHGINDESVSFDNAERLKEWSRSATLLPMKDGTHTFATSHPWKESILPKPMKALVDETIGMLENE